MTIGKYIFYKIQDRKYRGSCMGLSTMLKFLKILRSQKIKDITMHESKKHYTVEFFSEVR